MNSKTRSASRSLVSDRELDAIDRLFPSHIKVVTEAEERQGMILIDGQARRHAAAAQERVFVIQHNDGQPIKRQEGRAIGRNDPCPCGSGRKFKQCHRNDKDYQTVA
jgi:preprotein translocase subunit SecA